MKIEIEFPMVRVFGDYHEIDVFKDALCDITGKIVKCREECFLNDRALFVGSFYIGEYSDSESTIRDKISELTR